jgi:hypothetical protein
MGLDELAADEELHHRRGDPDVGDLADVPPRSDMAVSAVAGICLLATIVTSPEATYLVGM